MKKDLITISPLCVILFVFLWISQGLKCALVFFGIALKFVGIVLFIVALIYGIGMWVTFIDKHIKD